MKYYLAPMEGVTGYIFRKTQYEFFPAADKYFTPFINPHTTRNLNSKEKKEILPENNEGMYTVPQILTNKAEDFIRVAKVLKEFGYDEVNLNLGCPSGTVVSKKKGAGFLEFPTQIDQFLEEVFASLDMKISVKTRLGLFEADEFDQLLAVYNKYPLHELIIHPRVRTDYYKGKVDMETFSKALSNSKNPVCYNGDIFTVSDYEMWKKDYPQVESVMLGRGMIANPCLIGQIRDVERIEKEQLKDFHDKLLEEYIGLKIGDRNVLFKMKELWHYFICLFEDTKKLEKQIKKAQNMETYKSAVNMLFAQRNVVDGAGYLSGR